MTPRRGSGHEIDIGAGLEVVEYLTRYPVTGLALLGATGEFVHFDVADRIKFAAMAIRRSPKPMIVNVSHSTYPGTLLLAHEALAAGAAAVLVMPPYFFRYSQPTILAFYERLARDGVAPVLVYNLPFFTSPLEPATAVSLLGSGTVAGIKDSSGDPEMLAALLGARPSPATRVLVGNDRLFLRGCRDGADGVVSGVAGMAPELMTALWSATRHDNPSRTTACAALLDECLPWLERFPVPMGIKMAVNFRGFPAGQTAAPSSAAEAESFAEFERWFRDWHPRVVAACAAAGSPSGGGHEGT